MNTNRLINEFKIKVDWLDDSLEYYLKNREKLKVELRYGVKTNFTKPNYTNEIRRSVGAMNVGIQNINERDFIVVPALQIREHKDMKPNILYFRISINISHNLKILPEDFVKYTCFIGVVEFEMKNFEEPMTCLNQHISINYLHKGSMI